MGVHTGVDSSPRLLLFFSAQQSCIGRDACVSSRCHLYDTIPDDTTTYILNSFFYFGAVDVAHEMNLGKASIRVNKNLIQIICTFYSGPYEHYIGRLQMIQWRIGVRYDCDVRNYSQFHLELGARTHTFKCVVT